MQWTYDGEQIHAAFCQAAGIEPGHGSQVAVAEELGTSPQWYGKVIHGKRGSLEQIGKWCVTLGVRLQMLDGVITCMVPRTLHADGVPATMGIEADPAA